MFSLNIMVHFLPYFSKGLSETETNAKDTALLEKIKAKEQKIQNMQEENRRIYMKEASQPGKL